MSEFDSDDDHDLRGMSAAAEALDGETLADAIDSKTPVMANHHSHPRDGSPASVRRRKWLLAVLPILALWAAVAVGITATNGGSLRSTPIDYYEDSLFQYGVASAVNESGMAAAHPRLNFPFGADWRDFAVHTDSASLAQYWVISFFSDSPIQIVNIAFVLSYFLCSTSLFLVARRLGVRSGIAWGLGLGYAFLPYHFFRGIHHQFMSQYWTLPLLVWVAGEIGWGTKRPNRWLPLAVAAGLCALNGAYYTVFGALLIAVAMLIRLVSVRPALALRHWTPTFPALVGFVGGGFLSVLPSVAARAADGVNYRTPSRMMGDGDTFALRPAFMFAPVEGHRFGPFREWAANVARAVPGLEREAMAIGALASLGLVVAGLIVIRSSVGRRSDEVIEASQPVRRFALLTMGFLAVALLVGSNGGLHWDASLLGATLIRSWGRISVVIATLALLVLGMALSHVSVDAISRRMSRSFGHSWVTASIAALALGAVMIWDQSPSRVVDASRIAEFTRSKAFYQQLERALPAGTAVFQLPVVPFPEHWLGSLLYNPLEGVFYTKTLKFSGGGIAGRQADWQENLVAQPEELFAELHDAGFGAVVVDRRGFGDPQWFIDQYEAVPNSRLLFEDADRIALDITEVRAPLDRPGYDLVHQPTIMFGEGLNRSTDGFAAWSSDSDGPLQSTTDSGRVEFHNRTAKPYRACVNFRLKATTAPDGSTTRHITLTTPHHSNDQAVDLGAGASADFAVSVVLPPGITTWTLRAKGGPELDASRRRSAAAMFGVSMSGSFGTAPTCSQAE